MKRSRTTGLRALLSLVGVTGLAVVTIIHFRSAETGPPARGPELPAAGRRTLPISLYFGEPEGSRLTAEGREILVSTDRETTLERVVNELLRGSGRGNRNLFRTACRVRAMFLSPDGNLTLDFQGAPFPAEASETECSLALESLLRVLMELFPEVQTLSLLADGMPLSQVETRLAVPDVLSLSEWLKVTAGDAVF